MKRLTVLGATGSVGRRALELIGHFPGQFSVEGDVVGGPPPRPMAQYECRVVDGEVQVGPLFGEV